MVKRKAERKVSYGLNLPIEKNSKRARIPTTKGLQVLVEKYSEDDLQYADDGGYASSVVKKLDFSETALKSPFSLSPNTEWVKEGKNWISLPISLGDERPQSPAWLRAVGHSVGAERYDTDVFEAFVKHSHNFRTVTPMPLNLDCPVIVDLNLRFAKLLPTDLANHVFVRLENEVNYLTGKMTRRKLSFIGLSLKLPRSHVAFGDNGLTYTFDGNVIPVKPFIPVLDQLRRIVSRLMKVNYNFVVVNKFKSGAQFYEENKSPGDLFGDADMDCDMVTLLIGQPREMFLRQMDMPKHRGTTLVVDHGSILITNGLGCVSWWHSFPPKKGTNNPSLVLQFIRKLTMSG